MINPEDLPPSPIPSELLVRMAEIQRIARWARPPKLIAWQNQMREVIRPAFEAMRAASAASRMSADLTETLRRMIPPDEMLEVRSLFAELARQQREHPRDVAEFRLEVSDPKTTRSPGVLTFAELLVIFSAWATVDTWAPQLREQNLAEWGRTLWTLAFVLAAFAMVDTKRQG